VGKTHDYRIFKEEFPPTEDWFTEHEVHVDLGFYGIEKDYAGKAFSIPHKKPKQQELTQEQKAENKLRARQRVTVEHSICGFSTGQKLSRNCGRCTYSGFSLSVQ